MARQVNLVRSKVRQRMMTRLAESSGRPLERHGNVSPREMAVEGAKNPGTEPGVQVGPFAPNHHEGPDDLLVIGAFAVHCAQSPARDAAPMMPELLRWIAGTIGVLRSRSGRKSPAFFETPPPTTNRSGLNRNSMCE